MKIIIDSEQKTLVTSDGQSERTVPLYSKDAFDVISKYWLKIGWDLKYTYGFTWLGRPIIQLPEDLMKIQEVIYSLRPTLIIETGVAHGGSLIFYASLCRLIGSGRIIGIDIEIRKHNREAIEQHDLNDLITLVEGSSVASETITAVKSLVRPDDKVLVLLDSNHTRAHVMSELNAYASLVTVGSFIVVADGIMRDLTDVPRGKDHWIDDNPAEAAQCFASENPNFVLETPEPLFNEGMLKSTVTYWPHGWLRRVC